MEKYKLLMGLMKDEAEITKDFQNFFYMAFGATEMAIMNNPDKEEAIRKEWEDELKPWYEHKMWGI